MACRAVIFDLDGTLLDTLADIADAANRVLAACRFPTHHREAYRWFVGEGSAVLMTRALPPEQRQPAKVAECLQAFLSDYNRSWHRATRPYAGIVALLALLRERGLRLAVVTNKPHAFACLCVAHFFNNVAFDAILGQLAGVPKKPHPQEALAACRAMGVAPAECLFVGDSGVDMQTAAQAGMLAVGAAWGFRPVAELVAAGARHLIRQPEELLRLLDAG